MMLLWPTVGEKSYLGGYLESYFFLKIFQHGLKKGSMEVFLAAVSA